MMITTETEEKEVAAAKAAGMAIVAAFQAQQQQIEKLRSRVEYLENRLQEVIESPSIKLKA